PRPVDPDVPVGYGGCTSGFGASLLPGGGVTAALVRTNSSPIPMFAATGLRLSTADSFCTHPVTVIAADAFFCSLAGDEGVCAAAVTPHTMTAAATDVDHRFMLMSHLSIHSRGDSWNQ